MDTWIECAWFQCRKRFEPNRYTNQFYRADGRYHEGRKYCSRSCQQKAYRLRKDSVTIAEGITTQGTVTRPKDIIETKQEFFTKIDHARPQIQLSEGYVYSDWQPWPPSKWQPIGKIPLPSAGSDDDLTIPDFLMRTA
jgi:hypothetical protein